MNSPLAESWAKVSRAKEHTNTLNTEVALWLQEMEAKRDVASTRFEYDPQTGRCEGFIGNVPSPPPYRFGVIIGDVMHNLRSALDHLAWELANIGTPNRGEDRSTQFPITLSEDEFGERPVKRMMRFMRTKHRELIKDEQPWAANPNSPKTHPLAALAWYSNRDKHQGIHPVSISIETYYRYPVPIRDCSITNQTTYGANLEEGAKIMSMTIVPTGPNPQVNVQPATFPPTVQLIREQSVGRADFITRNLRNHVAEVLATFDTKVFQPQQGGN